MSSVSVREARENISKLLDAVSHGEEVVICRHGKPVAKLVRTGVPSQFPDRSEFRAGLPKANMPASQVVRVLRDEEKA